MQIYPVLQEQVFIDKFFLTRKECRCRKDKVKTFPRQVPLIGKVAVIAFNDKETRNLGTFVPHPHHLSRLTNCWFRPLVTLDLQKGISADKG